jgi:hypothetical protein
MNSDLFVSSDFLQKMLSRRGLRAAVECSKMNASSLMLIIKK